MQRVLWITVPTGEVLVGLFAFRYCYHFGVAVWLREHMMPEDLTTEAGWSGQDEGKVRK